VVLDASTTTCLSQTASRRHRGRGWEREGIRSRMRDSQRANGIRQGHVTGEFGAVEGTIEKPMKSGIRWERKMGWRGRSQMPTKAGRGIRVARDLGRVFETGPVFHIVLGGRRRFQLLPARCPRSALGDEVHASQWSGPTRQPFGHRPCAVMAELGRGVGANG